MCSRCRVPLAPTRAWVFAPPCNHSLACLDLRRPTAPPTSRSSCAGTRPRSHSRRSRRLPRARRRHPRVPGRSICFREVLSVLRAALDPVLLSILTDSLACSSIKHLRENSRCLIGAAAPPQVPLYVLYREPSIAGVHARCLCGPAVCQPTRRGRSDTPFLRQRRCCSPPAGRPLELAG